VGLSGLQDVAKALVACYVTHELRRPAFFVTENNRRAEELAESLRFFSQIFPGPTGGVAVLPAFDSLPWDPQAPHADILERRAATLYRLANGEVSLVIAPTPAAMWRYQDPYVYLTLARVLAKDTEANHAELIAHLASIGYARTEMVELPGQFAVRGGIVDVFSPEALRPVRPANAAIDRAGGEDDDSATGGVERSGAGQPRSGRVGTGGMVRGCERGGWERAVRIGGEFVETDRISGRAGKLARIAEENAGSGARKLRAAREGEFAAGE
jgi:hypothetical protein